MIKKFINKILILLTVFFVGFTTISTTLPSSTFAARRANCSNSQGILSATNIGLPTFGCGGNTSIIETIVKLTFGALAMISLLFVVIGGLRYALSGGDSNAIAQAKKTITYAVLGLVLGISVFIITSFIFGVIS